jgi:ABC-type taurine transport system substrate-binding protein
LVLWGKLLVEKEFHEAFPQIMEGPNKVGFLAMDYRVKYSRWPKNTAELQKYIKEKNLKSEDDLTAFKNLTFSETPKKTLRIHFDSYNKGAISLGPSDEEIGGAINP